MMPPDIWPIWSRTIPTMSSSWLSMPGSEGKGVLIFRTDNAEKAAEVIASNGLSVIEEKDLSRLL